MVFRCDYCEFMASSYQLLFYHYVVLHDMKMLACKYCDYICTRRGKLVRHIRCRHLDELTTPNDLIEDHSDDIITSAAPPDHFLCYFQQQSGHSFKCVFCDEYIKHKEDLSKHLQTQHLPSQFVLDKTLKKFNTVTDDSINFSCKLCQASCSDIQLLAGHIFASHPINMFSHKGPSQFKSLENLDILKLKCTQCSYRTFSYSHFQKHTLKHAAKLAFKCDFCSMTSDYQSIIKKHMNYCHFEKSYKYKNDSELETGEAEPVSTVQCHFCKDKFYKSTHTLKKHMRAKHLSARKSESIDEWDDSSQESNNGEASSFEPSIFRCEYCNLDFQLFESLKSHCTNYHKKAVLTLNCDQCSFMTNQVRILTSHIATHSTFGSHQPTAIQKPTTSSKYSNSHQAMTKNPNKMFECLSCHKMVKGWSQYMTHRKLHSKKNDARFKCHRCSFVGSSVSILKQHMSLHTIAVSSRMYRHICSKCPYHAKDAINLGKHLKCHNKPNCRHICPHCSYSCNNLSFLNRHVYVHSKQYVSRFAQGPKLPAQEGPETSVKPREVADFDGGDLDKDLEEIVESAIEKSRLVASKVNIGDSEDPEQTSLANAEKMLNFLHCEKCPFVGDGVEAFINHTSLHFYRRPFQCVYCDYSVPSFAYLLVHRSLHHPPNDNLLYTQSIDNLKKLPESQEIAENVIDEDLYSKMYEFSAEFSLQPTKPFTCNTCPFSCSDRASFLLHLRGHDGQYKFKCIFCTFSDPCRNEISSHMAVHFNLPGSSLSSHLVADSQNYREAFLSKILKMYCPEEKREDVMMETDDQDSSVADALEKTNGDRLMEKSVTISNDNDNIEVANINVKVEDGVLKEELGFNEETILVCKYCSRSFDLKSHLTSHEAAHTKSSMYLRGVAV